MGTPADTYEEGPTGERVAAKIFRDDDHTVVWVRVRRITVAHIKLLVRKVSDLKAEPGKSRAGSDPSKE